MGREPFQGHISRVFSFVPCWEAANLPGQCIHGPTRCLSSSERGTWCLHAPATRGPVVEMGVLLQSAALLSPKLRVNGVRGQFIGVVVIWSISATSGYSKRARWMRWDAFKQVCFEPCSIFVLRASLLGPAKRHERP